MNIHEEKAHIYEMMKDITSERRRLTDFYFGLKERLDELNKLEEKGLTNLSVKGYVDLHKEVQKKETEQKVRNIEREAQYAVAQIKKEAVVEEKKEVVPRQVIQEAKEKEDYNNKSARFAGVSIDKVMGNIVYVLKKNKKPMHRDRIYEEVNELMGGIIKEKNFKNNMLPRALNKSNNIARSVIRGEYEYKA